MGDIVYHVDATLRAGIAAAGITTEPFDERQLKRAGAIAFSPDFAAILRNFGRSQLDR